MDSVIDFDGLKERCDRGATLSVKPNAAVGNIHVERLRPGLKTTIIDIASFVRVDASLVAEPCVQVGVCFGGALRTGPEGVEGGVDRAGQCVRLECASLEFLASILTLRDAESAYR